jgi:hypothetical protein
MNKKLHIKRVLFDSFLLFLSVFTFSIKSTQIQASNINTVIGIQQKSTEIEKKIFKNISKIFIQYQKKITPIKIIFSKVIILQLGIILFCSKFYKDLFRIQW